MKSKVFTNTSYLYEVNGTVNVKPLCSSENVELIRNIDEHIVVFKLQYFRKSYAERVGQPIGFCYNFKLTNDNKITASYYIRDSFLHNMFVAKKLRLQPIINPVGNNIKKIVAATGFLTEEVFH